MCYNSFHEAPLKKFLLLSLAIFIIICLVYIHLASTPYTVYEEVRPETVSAFSFDSFTSDTPSGESARILFSNEEALERRMQLVNNAKERITLSTFELKIDDSTRPLIAALMMAARRGVEVRFLVDGAYPYRPDEIFFLSALGRQKNATVKIYNPRNPFAPGKWMSRLHDKYLIVDDEAYILGGRNTTEGFLGKGENKKNYDWDVLVRSGGENPSIRQVQDYAETVWAYEDVKVRYNRSLFWFVTKKAEDILEELWEESKVTHPEWYEVTDYSDLQPVNRISLLHNPIETHRKEPVLFYNLTELMKRADGDIVFHTPYIVLNDYMEERLREVTGSGKHVTAMTNTPPNNDNMVCAADFITNKVSILDTGLDILEFNGGRSYHGKCFTLGQRLLGVGSFNWDIRSAYLDTELMLVLDSPPLNQELRDYMSYYENQALKVRPDGTYVLEEGQSEPEAEGIKKFMIKLLIRFDKQYHYLL